MSYYSANELILQLKLSSCRPFAQVQEVFALADQLRWNLLTLANANPSLVGTADLVASRGAAIGIDYVRSCRMPRDSWTFENCVLLPEAQGLAKPLPPRFVPLPRTPSEHWPHWLPVLWDVLTLSRRSWTYVRLMRARHETYHWRALLSKMRLPADSSQTPVPDEFEAMDELLGELNSVASHAKLLKHEKSDRAAQILGDMTNIRAETERRDVLPALLQLIGIAHPITTSPRWPLLSTQLEHARTQLQTVKVNDYGDAVNALWDGIHHKSAPLNVEALRRLLDHTPSFQGPGGEEELPSALVLKSIDRPAQPTVSADAPWGRPQVRLAVMKRLTKESPEWWVFHSLLAGNDIKSIAEGAKRWLPPPSKLSLEMIQGGLATLRRSHPAEHILPDWITVYPAEAIENCQTLLCDWMASAKARPDKWNLDDVRHEIVSRLCVYRSVDLLSRLLQDVY